MKDCICIWNMLRVLIIYIKIENSYHTQHRKLMMTSQQKIVDVFQNRTKLFTFLNVLIILWTFTQIVIYAIQVSLAPCSQIKSMGIGYLFSYIIYIGVPVMAILSCHKCDLTIMTIVYCAFNIVIKIVVLVILFTVGWRHVGQCFIAKGAKTVISSCSVVQILILLIEVLMMYRRRQINILKRAIAKSFQTFKSDRTFQITTPGFKET